MLGGVGAWPLFRRFVPGVAGYAPVTLSGVVFMALLLIKVNPPVRIRRGESL